MGYKDEIKQRMWMSSLWHVFIQQMECISIGNDSSDLWNDLAAPRLAATQDDRIKSPWQPEPTQHIDYASMLLYYNEFGIFYKTPQTGGWAAVHVRNAQHWYAIFWTMIKDLGSLLLFLAHFWCVCAPGKIPAYTLNVSIVPHASSLGQKSIPLSYIGPTCFNMLFSLQTS